MRSTLRGLAVSLVIAIAAGLGAATITAAPEGAASREAKLQQALDRVVAAGSPGVIALVRDGDRTIRLTSGYGNLKTKSRIRATDRFRVGSVTKSFVATVVLQLVAEGKLSLDDTVERWLPGLVPNGSAITVHQLLNMSSGLYDYLSDPSVFAPYLRGNFAYVWSPRRLVEIAVSHEPLFAPGAGWRYCNTCYVALGLIVEKATGNSLETELRRRIFAPLRLTATSFPAKPRLVEPHARGYELLGKPPLVDVSDLSPTWGWAAGAIVSTADDIARFYRTLLGGRLLRPDLLRAMETRVAGSGGTYGLGLYTLEVPCGTTWGHDGGTAGYRTLAFNSKDGQRQVVLLANAGEDTLPRRAHAALSAALATAFCDRG